MCRSPNHLDQNEAAAAESLIALANGPTGTHSSGTIHGIQDSEAQPQSAKKCSELSGEATIGQQTGHGWAMHTAAKCAHESGSKAYSSVQETGRTSCDNSEAPLECQHSIASDAEGESSSRTVLGGGIVGSQNFSEAGVIANSIAKENSALAHDKDHVLLSGCIEVVQNCRKRRSESESSSTEADSAGHVQKRTRRTRNGLIVNAETSKYDQDFHPLDGFLG